MKRDAATSPRRVRVYQSVRTAHLERFEVLEPAEVYFIDSSYDFDPALATRMGARRCAGRGELFTRLLRSPVDALEVNEPLMVPGLKSAVVAIAAVRVRGLLTRRRTMVVAYAIENSDPYQHLREVLRWRIPLYVLATRFIVRNTDRLVFGTAMSRLTYQPYLRHFHGRTADIPALPTACESCGSVLALDTLAEIVTFVGAFNERKGIRDLLAAWPTVRRMRPAARLRILGKGALLPLVETAVCGDSSITLDVDPNRLAIHRALHEAKVSVLLSVPHAGWREQVGLPIVEALSHGCEVVCSDQTGLAPWLLEHGHRVVPAGPSTAEVAEAIVGALTSVRSPAEVCADLPGVDGRLAADRWMFQCDSQARA